MGRHDEPLDAAGDGRQPFVPSAQQARYLAQYLDLAVPANIKALAAAAHVCRRSVYRWLADEAFCRWFADECGHVLRHRLPRVWLRCAELAEAGSPEHIRLLGMRTGELREKVPAGGRAGITQVFLNVPRPPRAQLEPAERLGTINITPAVLTSPRSDSEH